jgi:formate hydrogenlyase subunit 7
MSRWILRGLRTGIKTTRFPGHELIGEEGSPSTVQLRWQGLTPAGALTAAAICPTSAIEAAGNESAGELRFDAGACIMCGRCARVLPAAFTTHPDPRVAVRDRQQLRATVRWGDGQGPALTELQAAATEVHSRAVRLFRHSLHIRHVDAGSCNGCESELQMLGTPYLDLHRLGFFFTATPRHADVLLVTGVVNRNMEEPLLATYAAMPAPKLVIAAGACALSGGSFADGLMTNGPVDRLLPVDVYVPGCPPTPQAFLHGLLVAVDRAEQRYLASAEGHDGA